MTTAIEWTDETWNPVVGCSIASPGCDNCYAAKEAAGRLSGLPQYKGLAVRVDGVPQFTGEVRCLPERLDQPSRWKKPRRIFVNSMSDLFHPDVPTMFIGSVWDRMAAAQQHTFQVLTKRPQRMSKVLYEWASNGWLWRRGDWMWCGPLDEPPSNVWCGTSIESDRYVWRADHLRETPAAVRFLSLEPLLGPLPSLDLTDIDWVIVGGESGPRARPMHPDWVRSIRDQCVAAGVPFFFKQWGEYGPAGVWGGPDHHVLINGVLMQPGARLGMNDMMQPAALHRWGKKQAGRTLDGRTWDEYPT